MPDYQAGKIYVIRAPGTDDVYIGSTTLPLSQRFANHKCEYKRWKDGATNRTSSFDLIEREGSYIELLEAFPCNSKEELNKREGELIRSTSTSINKCVAGRTPKEYKEDNKERLDQKSKEWCDKNREHINKTKRDWYNKNREYVCQVKRAYYQKKCEQKVE